MIEQKINPDFLVELLKTCFSSEKVLQITRKELKYQFLENDNQKKVVKHLFNVYDLENKLPSFGELSQKFNADAESINFLAKIKNSRPPDDKDKLLITFEEYIKKAQFNLAIQKTVEIFNQGKYENAIDYMAKQSKEINDFQLKESYYTRVFADYEKRADIRKNTKQDQRLFQKLTWGIHELDDITRGGIAKGTIASILARSGVGKSTFLKWVATANAYLGARVVHFQLEGSEKECLDLYDACWTNNNLEDIEFGTIPQGTINKIKHAQQNILSNGGEIYVYASEKFDSLSIEESREICKDIENIYGPIDMIVYDYAEISNVRGDFGGESGERRRREVIVNKMTNIALEFYTAVLTAIQANDIKFQVWNNPDLYLTRSDISEFKGMVKPMSYFLTLNQTLDEYEAGIMRIYCDKFRKHKSGQIVRIYQDVTKGRFYDAKKTLNEFYIKN